MIQIPATDKHKNRLKDLGPVAWQWLEHKIPHLIHSIHIEGPHAGHKGSKRHLHVLALDTPESDSHVKQLAVHIGELVNRRYVFVHKEGSSGIQTWRLNNKAYDGGAARPEAIEFQHATSPAWGHTLSGL